MLGVLRPTLHEFRVSGKRLWRMLGTRPSVDDSGHADGTAKGRRSQVAERKVDDSAADDSAADTGVFGEQMGTFSPV